MTVIIELMRGKAISRPCHLIEKAASSLHVHFDSNKAMPP